MTQKTGIERALDMYENSPSKLASAIGCGVLRQHVEHWLSAGRVSAEKAPDVAAATGISLEDLNGRVNWSLARKTVRMKRKPGPAKQGA